MHSTPHRFNISRGNLRSDWLTLSIPMYPLVDSCLSFSIWKQRWIQALPNKNQNSLQNWLLVWNFLEFKKEFVPLIFVFSFACRTATLHLAQFLFQFNHICISFYLPPPPPKRIFMVLEEGRWKLKLYTSWLYIVTVCNNQMRAINYISNKIKYKALNFKEM